MAMLLNAAIVLLTVVAMEAVAWLVHRHVMHGVGWGWHASHHAPRQGLFEKNDLYALVPTCIAIALVWMGMHGHETLLWVGTGMTVYGGLYFIAHDGLVHRRWPLRITPRRGYLKRLVQAHRLHHAVSSRDGAVSFGFLWAPSPQRLREQLQQLQTLRSRRGRQAASGHPPSTPPR
jgi:beta-carotene 3-hydroxylase